MSSPELASLSSSRTATEKETPSDVEGRERLEQMLTHAPGITLQKTLLGNTYLVSFDGDEDPYNPQNWSARRKAMNASVYMLASMSSSFASGVLSPATPQISHRFHISDEVATFSTATLFLLGYVAGPFVWSPMCESKGRKLPMTISMFGFICFGAMTATAMDYQTLCITRFLQGAMGACPLTITLGTCADYYNVYQRNYVATIFALTVFAGPMLASPIGGFTADNASLRWRWCCWWGVFMGTVSLVGIVFCTHESYVPYLLKDKAHRLRVETEEWAIHAKADMHYTPPREKMERLLKMPFEMLTKEPILFLIAIYTAFVYAILYTFLVAYTIVFVEGYGMNPGVGGLPFFGLIVGLLLATLANLIQTRYFNRWTRKNNGVMVPEWRMPIAFSGAIAFVIGLFWFGWTGAYPKSVHWIVPTVSGIVTGYGILMIFICFFTFLLDMYKANAAPAFAAVTIVRSGLAAAFPLFATQMFHNLGVEWATTLLACLAALLTPVPIIFYYYGARIRARSSFVPDS